ncbi:MAG: KilA-N domain-containing protein [Arsenophonus sp.]|nr:KilA-N domain-containing protein [Arsenophonus sp.]
MSKLVVIENTIVRQDAFGRYCLNDLHRAAVAQGKATESQRPSVFLRSEGINNFVQKISEASNGASVNIIKGGLEAGRMNLWPSDTLRGSNLHLKFRFMNNFVIQ